MLKIFTKTFFATFVIFIASFANGQISNAANTDYEVILNKIDDGGESKIQSRHIFVYLNENIAESYDVSKITAIFNQFKEKYPVPFDLRITIYSDKAMLERLIKFEKQPMTIEFSNNEVGRKAAEKFYEKNYPLPTGYFRFEYHRYGDFEFFDYSPDKEHPTIRVTLKTRAKIYLSSKDFDNDLISAVRGSDIEAVRQLLAAGANPNKKDENGNTPIFYAAVNDNSDIINLLVKSGGNISDRDIYGQGLLENAILRGRKSALQTLIALGADVKKINGIGLTSLMVAVRSKNTEIVKALLKAGAEVNTKTIGERTALMLSSDDKEVNRLLISAGAKIDETDVGGHTALFYSIANGELNKFVYLLEAGAKTDIVNHEGLSPLEFTKKQDLPLEIKNKMLEMLKPKS